MPVPPSKTVRALPSGIHGFAAISSRSGKRLDRAALATTAAGKEWPSAVHRCAKAQPAGSAFTAAGTGGPWESRDEHRKRTEKPGRKIHALPVAAQTRESPGLGTHAPPGGLNQTPKIMLNRFFKLNEHGHHRRPRTPGRLTTFAAMAYIPGG